jgi:hypothetical protein
MGITLHNKTKVGQKATRFITFLQFETDGPGYAKLRPDFSPFASPMQEGLSVAIFNDALMRGDLTMRQTYWQLLLAAAAVISVS